MPRNIPEKGGMKRLLSGVEKTKREIEPIVRKRMREFKNNRNHFSELCFCILTANYTAEGGIKIQCAVNDFSCLRKNEIEKTLRKMGHRFPKTRADYINEAKKCRNELEMLSEMEDSFERREWLVENVKGLGYKEASHFLRNIGYSDVAIIDRHIISIMKDYGLIEAPKTITKKRYLEIERILEKLSSELSVSLGELDLYLWYMKTGKILK